MSAERYGPQLDDLYEEELRALRAEGSKRKPPRPTGAVCSECVPVFAIGPSGRRLRHEWSCPTKPGEPISASEYAQGRTWHPSGRRPR